MNNSQVLNVLQKSIQGEFKLELKFSDERVFMNYWDMIHGNDVCVQVRDGKLFLFIHSASEVEDEEFEGDAFAQKEITITEFIDLIKKSISGN